MQNPRLHIVAFDIPWPADYGGAIEVFYKIKALHAIGVGVILHCFEYGTRTPAAELEALCERVIYYPRSRSVFAQLSFTPFIIATRKHPDLLKNLLSDNAPILFEGLHTCGFVGHPALKTRRKAVRVHNIEWTYYHDLAASATDLAERIYFTVESRKLKRVEAKLLQSADVLLPLSSTDAAKLNHQNINVINVFHPNEAIQTQCKTSQNILFHARLSVADNQRVALLLAEIAAQNNLQITIAGGGDIPESTLKILANNPNITLVRNLSQTDMNELMVGAHIQIVWSFQSSGVKLKTLNALFTARHIVANRNALSGMAMSLPCHLAETKNELAECLKTLINQPFQAAELEVRRTILGQYFDNGANAEKLAKAVLG